jgi:pyruvate dehydrogenase E2 component (dihydrolipoamide acetyltransferase)
MIEFRMPNLGADMEAGTLCEWRVKPGDRVNRGDIIAEVETQKGVIEIEVFDSGILDSLILNVGDKVPVDAVMALIKPDLESDKETALNLPGAPSAKTLVNQEKTPQQTSPLRIKASPLAKRMAEENEIDLTKITGTGELGAITKEDVEKAIAEKTNHPGNKPELANDSIRLAIAAAMSKSNREIPHYYLETTIDMSKALKWLSESNRQRDLKDRLLPVVLLIKATAKALKTVPELNAVWDNGLVLKNDINIGFVVALRQGGLMIPAIHYAETKSLTVLMENLNDLIPRARNLKLKSSELSDSTITITSIGDSGADKIFGIIYPPQVAIVGFGAISEQPWAENGMLDVRHVITATLSADHRATDGHTGSRFMTQLKKELQNPEEL